MEEKIEAFWQWFVKYESTIKGCIEAEDAKQQEYVVKQLDDHILGMGVFSWDIGLNPSNQWFLMISPNGNPDMLAISEGIMSDAPEHMDWLFYAGKPALEWNRQFSIYDNEMDEQFIDASDWNFLVYEDEEDGSIELVIEANNLAHLEEDVADAAAEEFVTQEIGEHLRILLISSIVVVPELDIEDEASKIHVTDIKTHLEAGI